MNKIFSFILCFLLGVFGGNIFSEYNGKQLTLSQRVDFVYKGKVQEKLWFKTYNDTLFSSDNSVLKYEEGIISTPQCAAEVAKCGGTAFLELYRPTGMIVMYTHFK